MEVIPHRLEEMAPFASSDCNPRFSTVSGEGRVEAAECRRKLENGEV